MVFTSVTFLVFFAIFFVLYWFVFSKTVKWQNLLVLAANYLFYVLTDWRLLLYLVAVSVLNYYLGIYIEKTTNQKQRSRLLLIGLAQGIGGLFFFKYFNFFIESFNQIFDIIGFNFSLATLNIIVPVGISFFTFRTMSYLLDVDKEKIIPTKNWVIFFNYVSFFPTLLSGPIDRARDFIPQLENKRKFDYTQSINGLRQILWGLFKKIVIADNCASITNEIFNNYEIYPASSLVVGAMLYTIQIYADFSGYSDMAIGFSRLIGFNLTKNFNFPFFTQNIADFWRGWHISLTSWLTEYVFTPLVIFFRDYNKVGLVFAIVINFVIIGAWHGANWTYILFGLLHGCYYIPLIIKGTMNKKKKISKDAVLPSLKEFGNMVVTFLMVAVTFIIFKSENVTSALDYMASIFSLSLFTIPKDIPLSLLIFIIGFIVLEWMGRNQDYGIQYLAVKKPIYIRWGVFLCIVLAILGNIDNQQDFIYLQF